MRTGAPSILCATLLFMPCALHADPPPTDDPRPVGRELAKRYIGPKMHQPQTADFGMPEVDKGFRLQLNVPVNDGAPVLKKITVEQECVVTWEDGTFSQIVSVSGIVRGMNNINAPMASSYRVIMTSDEENNWVPLLVMLDDKQNYFLDPVKGPVFFNFLVDREDKKEQQVAMEKKRKVEQDVRKAHLQKCHDAGIDAGKATAEKFGNNVKTAPAELVDKQANKALSAAAYTDTEEQKAFRNGFQKGYDSVKSMQ